MIVKEDFNWILKIRGMRIDYLKEVTDKDILTRGWMQGSLKIAGRMQTWIKIRLKLRWETTF